MHGHRGAESRSLQRDGLLQYSGRRLRESALSYVQEGQKEEDSEEQPALLFNEIVITEKMADYDSAKEKLREYLELYPGDIDAVRENYLLETR